VKQVLRIVAVLAALAAPSVAAAHEGHMHKYLGTVSKVDGVHVTLKTTDGKDVTVMLDDKTAVTRGAQKLDASAIKVGERASVDGMEEKGMIMAHAVKLATTPPKK
jgi:hypothetical protein